MVRLLVPKHTRVFRTGRPLPFRGGPPAERCSPGGCMARSRVLLSICAATLLTAVPAAAASDPVLEWMKITNDTIIATGTSPLLTARQAALVSSAVFDAVNGIDRRFQPIHFRAKAPRHASERAAAIQAAYAILAHLYPALTASLTPRRDASIAAIGTGPGADSSAAIM